MILKLFGALCVILGCWGVGLAMAANARKEIISLRQLIAVLDYMECELSYRMTSLSQLFRLSSGIANGSIQRLTLCIAEELEQQRSSSVNTCVVSAIKHCPDLTPLIAQRVIELGKTLGSFDLAGQIKCIRGINSENARILDNLTGEYANRFRSYKTLGICAGVALAILLV